MSGMISDYELLGTGAECIHSGIRKILIQCRIIPSLSVTQGQGCLECFANGLSHSCYRVAFTLSALSKNYA